MAASAGQLEVSRWQSVGLEMRCWQWKLRQTPVAHRQSPDRQQRRKAESVIRTILRTDRWVQEESLRERSELEQSMNAARARDWRAHDIPMLDWND